MMTREKREVFAYSLLLLYFVILAGMCDSGTIGLLIGIAVGDLFTILIYRAFDEKSFLYGHFFLALLAAAVPYIAKSGIYAWDVLILYSLLLLLFLHFVLLRFGEYGKIHSITYLLYFSSVLVSMATVILLLYFPLRLGAAMIAAMLLAMVAIYYFLTRPNP